MVKTIQITLNNAPPTVETVGYVGVRSKIKWLSGKVMRQDKVINLRQRRNKGQQCFLAGLQG